MAKSKRSKPNPTKSAKPSKKLLESLKNHIRTHSGEYLLDPNISSVGIGYKEVKGVRSKQLCLQFTVDAKVELEALESLDSNPIPTSINVEGTEIPTDVIERRFELSYRVVPESTGGERKSRIDPVVPGVSTAHFMETAGTLGCIAYDRHDGRPYALSNWHVLHGTDGVIGDDIVQPGPHDDNRIQQNFLGKLVRSHLGNAGDCAIASIEGRSFDPSILDLNTTLNEIGEPGLDDLVVKSGRTTKVTYGQVTRIHAVFRLNYGGFVGEQEIGGFEIGPADNFPAANGEISMGGDSGSCWVFATETGNPTKVMAGLHFAGETSSSPVEFALACYPKSVFEKLEITLVPPEKVSSSSSAFGYNAQFLGDHIPAPTLNVRANRDAIKLNSSTVIDYTHFSLALSKSKRFAFWVGWNIHGGQIRRLSRKGLNFKLDNRIPADQQAGNNLYSNNPLDRGHIARRADLVWGSPTEADQANKDSFYFTNIVPQMDSFNQSSKGGVWGRLENAIFEDVDVDELKISVFGGPVFRDDDREYRGFKIPKEFFKVLIYKDVGVLKSKGFLLTQNLNQLEVLDLDEFKTYEVALEEIEERCNFYFPKIMKSVDFFTERLSQLEDLGERKAIESTSDIQW